MTGFQLNTEDNGGRLEWHGYPDDDAAHRTILGWLEQEVTSGFNDNDHPVSNRVKGNIGEFIAYKVGANYVFTNGEIAATANAWNPLSDISQPGLDILWLYFGPTTANDWVAIQEVKTTSQSNLSLADQLVMDYDKLFSEDLRTTLRSRLDGVKEQAPPIRVRPSSAAIDSSRREEPEPRQRRSH